MRVLVLYLLTTYKTKEAVTISKHELIIKHLTPESSRSWETKRGNFKAATLPETPTRTWNVPEVFNKSVFILDMWPSNCIWAYCQKKNSTNCRTSFQCYTSVNIPLANQGRARSTLVTPARARPVESAHVRRIFWVVVESLIRAASMKPGDLIHCLPRWYLKLKIQNQNAKMTLTPLVYWAQRHEEIYLRVELTDAQVRAPYSTSYIATCHEENPLA